MDKPGWAATKLFMDRLKFVPPAEQKTYEVSEDIGSAKTILLLEDEAEFSEMLKDYLESFGYAVTVVRDGVQGLRKIMEKDYDVILCDLLMPNLPGDMFYLGVERVKPHLAKRFIFITGHQNNPKIAEFIRKTKALTLFKPFEMHVLIETIAVSLKRGQKVN